MVGAELVREFGLLRAARDGHDLVAEPVGVLDAQVAEAADALDRDERARSGVDLPERVERGDARAQQRDASSAVNPSGIRTSAVCRAVTYSAYPPSIVVPVCGWSTQFTKSPRRQDSHCPQWPPR
ncbi:hypothetical protein GCM10029964_046820 [Kibdelosporangium lantanae]